MNPADAASLPAGRLPTAEALHDSAGEGRDRPPLLSVIIPTYNECETIGELVKSVLEVTADVPTEVLVVDDNSPDGTGRIAEAMAAEDHRVRFIARGEKAGLSGAVFAGAAAARGTYICSMDADLSHDPEELPQMLHMAIQGADVVIGSRFVRGSMFIEQSPWRQGISSLLNFATRMALGLSPRDVLSGYVLCRREVIGSMATQYSAGGFKFLLELLATQPNLRVAEWPIRFRNRRNGHSKASIAEASRFVSLCGRLLVWRILRR